MKFLSSSLAALRVCMGALFLLAGLSKLTTAGWSAAGYLSGATGPFASWFQSMAGNAFVDGLNVWGQLLIGLALLLGVGVRAASFFGGLMMLLYYFAAFESNTAHGLIEEHIVYIFVLLVLASGMAGRHFGLGKWVEAQAWYKRGERWLRFVV